MSVSQKIMGLILGGPLTLGELAEALGKTETETKHAISPLISKRYVLRTRGLDETIEYKISPEGIGYHRRHLATLAHVEQIDDGPKPEVPPEVAAVEEDRVVAEPELEEELPLTEAPEAITADAGEPSAPEKDRIPCRISALSEQEDDPLSDTYMCEGGEKGYFYVFRSEHEAVNKAIEISSISGVDVYVFRTYLIGVAKHTVQFFRAF